MAATKCDNCRLAKTPIIYLRSSHKVCMACWQAEKKTNKSLVESLPDVLDKEAPLGYNFIINDWYQDQEKGKRYADWVFNSLQSVLS